MIFTIVGKVWVRSSRDRVVTLCTCQLQQTMLLYLQSSYQCNYRCNLYNAREGRSYYPTWHIKEVLFFTDPQKCELTIYRYMTWYNKSITW